MSEPDHVLVLRTCRADMRSPSPDAGDFRWPESGLVEAPDWSPEAKCGSGLHGLLWGEGDGGLLCWDADARWLVVRVERATVVDLCGKVKFPRGEVVFCGDRDTATRYLIAHGGIGHAVAGAALAAGDRGTATAGDEGTATAGDRGTATAGYRGTATAGDRGTATAGYRGTATAGDEGTATAGDEGTATAGDEGSIAIRWWDSAANRYRLAVGYVGTAPGKLTPRVAYHVVDGRLAATAAVTARACSRRR